MPKSILLQKDMYNVCVCKMSRWFLSSLITAAIGTLIIFIVGLVEFIFYFVDRDEGEVLKPYMGKECVLPSHSTLFCWCTNVVIKRLSTHHTHYHATIMLHNQVALERFLQSISCCCRFKR
jgi:hypothetical protein